MNESFTKLQFLHSTAPYLNIWDENLYTGPTTTSTPPTEYDKYSRTSTIDINHLYPPTSNDIGMCYKVIFNGPCTILIRKAYFFSKPIKVVVKADKNLKTHKDKKFGLAYALCKLRYHELGDKRDKKLWKYLCKYGTYEFVCEAAKDICHGKMRFEILCDFFIPKDEAKNTEKDDKKKCPNCGKEGVKRNDKR